jgi:hypothetical protein
MPLDLVGIYLPMFTVYHTYPEDIAAKIGQPCKGNPDSLNEQLLLKTNLIRGNPK